MSLFFISDLHLMEARPDITDAFYRFLAEDAASCEGLYVLGDFFEYWLGDDHDTPFNREVIQHLAKLDVPKYLMHGNRDFLLGDAFCNAAGMTLLPDPTVVDLYGRKVLLMHGDSLCTRDTEYMAARQMLRNPAVQADLLSKSIAEREAIARGARQQSESHTRETADDIMDVTPEEVVKVMADAGVDLLIHGHTHRPQIHGLEVNGQPARRIVLGDWDAFGWCLEVNPDGYELRRFEL